MAAAAQPPGPCRRRADPNLPGSSAGPAPARAPDRPGVGEPGAAGRARVAVRGPLAILHGSADAFIPASDAMELRDHVTAPCRLVIIPEMGHAFQPASVPEIVDAVDWVLASSRAYRLTLRPSAPTTTPGRRCQGRCGPP